MLNVRMGAITRYHSGLQLVLHVPGAWQARVATIQAEAWQLDAYARYYVGCGMQADKAYKLSLRTVQATYVQGYTKGLREAVARRAAEYAEMWPSLHRPIGKVVKGKLRGKLIVQLEGFVAADVQHMYVPYQNTGRAGQDYIKGMLADMGRKAGGNDEQHG